MNKSLNFSLEDIHENKIKFEVKNFYVIEKTVDIHLIYNREKPNLNLSSNFTKDLLIQNQSFILSNNSVHSQLIISESNKDIKKNIIYFKKRNSTDSIVHNKKANINKKRLEHDNNPFLQENRLKIR